MCKLTLYGTKTELKKVPFSIMSIKEQGKNLPKNRRINK